MQISKAFATQSECSEHLRRKMNAVNAMLINRCKNYGIGYLHNSNIKEDLLAKYGLHLNEVGKGSLANNFINFTNRYIL